MRVLITLIVLSSSFAIPALADCSTPPPEQRSLIVESCRTTDAEVAELIESGPYRGIVISASSQVGTRPYFVPAGQCEHYPAGRSVNALIGTACCDGDPNPPCYLGFSNFLIDPTIPRYPAISAGTISAWLAFEPAVKLTHVRSNANLYLANSAPGLYFSDAYMSNLQTQTQLHIMLFPPGKMFAPNREAMFTGIEQQLAYVNQNPTAMQPLFVGKTSREDGRVTTYAYFGGGPGGERYGAFTRLGNEQYELLVQLTTFSTDAIPSEQHPEIWARPTAELRHFMPSIEAHFLAQMKAQQNSAP